MFYFKPVCRKFIGSAPLWYFFATTSILLPPLRWLETELTMTNKNRRSTTPRLLNHHAIIYGVMIEIAGTILVSIAMSGVTRQVLGGRGMDEAQIKAFFQNQFENIPFMLAGLVPGFLVAGLAGYVAAKVADQLEYWHALIVVIMVAAVFYGPSLTRAPVWFSALSLAGILVSAMLGAGLSKRHKQSLTSPEKE